MLHFLQSIWLWAIAGILVPVFIHLWNVRDGKTLQVGSLGFLTENARSHAKSLRLSEWLLLLIRCLLLIVLAFLIAGPIFTAQNNTTKEKGWVLVERNELQDAHQQYGASIDSLLQQGFVLHYFEEKFPEGNIKDTLAVNNSGPHPRSYWSLLRGLNQQVPAKLPVYLFTGNRLDRFTGTRPTVALNLAWKTFHSARDSSAWIQSAYATITDSIAVITGNSHATGVVYAEQTIARSNDKKFILSSEDGKIMIALANAGTEKIAVDTNTLLACIYADLPGAAYLKAALEAIRANTRRKIDIVTISGKQSIPQHYDWLFWLSESPLPKEAVKGHVFAYTKGKISDLSSSLQTGMPTDADLHLTKMSIGNAIDGATIWSNGYGDALLQQDLHNDAVYHVYSRLDPQWNDLVWNASFPSLIEQLLFAAKNDHPIKDRFDSRMIDDHQLQPALPENANAVRKASLLHDTDLTQLCWIIAFLLFLTERILVHRKKKEVVYE